MRNYTVFFLLIFSFNLSFSQEICDNGIDDDGNGLVDINDPACDCNIIPNPSFENYYSCPTVPKQVDFLYNWISASNTPDYYNSCGYTSQVTNGNSPFRTPREVNRQKLNGEWVQKNNAHKAYRIYAHTYRACRTRSIFIYIYIYICTHLYI